MSSENILQQLKDSYITGIPNHLQDMENYILAMEDDNQYRDNYEALYRKTHSLKGSGGTHGFAIITSICHQMEDYISEALQNSDDVSQNEFDNIFKYIDLLKDTSTLLLNKNNEFQEIEDRLKKIKDEALTHEINGILVGPANNMYSQLCTQVFKQANAHCTIIESGMGALQRMLHEHFDFVVTSRENIDLSGPALIAALKVNQRKDNALKTILTTSNPDFKTCEATEPDFIILKNKSFDANLLDSIEKIKKSR